MHTELYSFNVFIIFQDTETVSERDVSMVDALEGSIPSLDGTFIIEQQDHCQSFNVSAEFEEEEAIVERYVHIFVTNAFLATVLYVNFKNEHCILVVLYACCITLPSFLFAEFEIDKSDFEAFSRPFKIAKISIKKIL
jgi:hypothetical protein